MLEVLLHLQQLDLIIRGSALRLLETSLWKQETEKKTGEAAKSKVLFQHTDYMVAKLIFRKHIKINI